MFFIVIVLNYSYQLFFSNLEEQKKLENANGGTTTSGEKSTLEAGGSKRVGWRRPTSCLSVKKLPSCRPS